MNGNGGKQHVVASPAWGAIRPAYANTFTVGSTREVVRLTFGEGFGTEEGSIFHTALIMGRTDAKLLAEGILTMLAKEAP
jgi:hypothetical protein